MRTSFGNVVYEVGCDGYLGACVAELGKCGVEEAVLFGKGLYGGVGVGFGGLEGHVCVGDFGNGGAGCVVSHCED